MEIAASLSVSIRMFQSSPSVEIRPDRGDRLPVDALTAWGSPVSTLPPPPPRPVCRVAAELLFLVSISEQIAVLWEQHAVRAPSTVLGTK